MAHKNVKTNISKNCPKWKMTLYSKISKKILYSLFILEFFLFFLAPFFLWILAGWFTLHCLWNREYFIYFLPLTYSLDFFAAALHVHMRTKVQLDFDPQLLSFTLYLSIKSLFTIETIQLKSVKVLGSWKIPIEKFHWYLGLNPFCNSQSCLWCIYCWIALIQTRNKRLV